MFWCFEQSLETIKSCFSSSINRSLTHLMAASTIAVLSILIGLTPRSFSSRNYFLFAYAQNISESQINKYAQALLNIELERQKAFHTIKSILGKNPSNIVCNQPATFSALAPAAQKVAVGYCGNSKKYVENSGLTIAQFNEITQQVRTNQVLQKNIGQAMLKLKNNHP